MTTVKCPGETVIELGRGILFSITWKIPSRDLQKYLKDSFQGLEGPHCPRLRKEPEKLELGLFLSFVELGMARGNLNYSINIFMARTFSHVQGSENILVKFHNQFIDDGSQ